RIQYLTPITGYASVTNWNTNISITNNSALADGASNSQALNKTAEISLNLSGHGFGGSTPSILREGVTCLEGICSVVNWNPTTTFLVFNVTGFTNYSALGNIVPSLTNAILNVTNETLVPSGDNIQANVTVSDPEGNATNFTIVFFVNNVANITAQLDNNYADGSTISYVFNNTNITTDQTINVQFNATDGSGSSNYLNTSKISTQIQIDPCDIGSPNTTCYISGVKVFPNGYNLQGTGNLIIQNGGSFYNITGSNISFNLANITIQSGGNITSVSSGANAAGTIILNATDTINITDKIIAIGPQNHGGTAGKGGTVNISAPNIILPGSINVTGGKLGSGNNGMPGDGGRVNFNGTSIDFTGRIDANGQSSRWQCIIGTSGHLSDGGIINITGTTVNISGSITVDRGGRVADDCNNGIAGNISIYAQNLNYTGTTNGTANGSLFRPYVLLNVSNTADIYGNITDIYYLRTKTLLLQKNANLGFRQNFVLDTPTKNNFSYWEGNITTSGDVNITATPFQINGSISKTTGTLRIETNTFEFNNSITTTNNTHSAIIINATGSITIKSGLTITADGQGTVPAGNITLIAGGTINITGIVRATGSTDYGATAAKGGNITINARNSVLLPGTVNVTGGRISLGNNGMPGEGGTVSINSTNIEITGKIDLNGQSSRSDCTIGTAGHLSNGGTINITGTTVNITGVIHANRGGPVGASYVCNNGLGGNISITGNNLNLSGATIIALGNHTGNAINGTNSLEYNTNLSTSGTNNITPTPYIARSNNYGRIQYLTPITGYASVTNWNTNISITNNSALADGASNSQALNKTAEITLNLTGHPIVNQPQLLRDSIACGAICTIINWNSITKILTFNVTGFSNYSTSKNNTSPYAIFNRPLQDENYTQDVFNITLNTTVYDQDLDNITTKIYAYGSKQLEVQPDGTSTVALYHLNNDSSVGENDTRIYDFTGLGNNGTCMMVTSGNTGYCPYMNTTGKLGGAVFNGTQGINITYNQLFNLTQKNFTINTWVLPQETVLAPIIILTPGADDKHQYKIYGSAANTWAISVTNTTNNAFSATSTADFTSNTTYTMITLLYNQSNDGTGRITLYTNGQERTNTLIQGNLLDNFTAPLKIGNGTAKAIIDELAIWNRTLTANEVITLYNKQKYGYYTSLVYKGNSTTQNGTQITYNFTTTPIIPDNTTILLMHFDNESWIGENDTRFYDFTGLGNNGSCSKSANTCPLLNQSSKIGWGVEFDATQNISLGIVPALNLTNNISIFAWIRASSKSDGVIISRGDVGNGQFGLGYGMNCAGKLDLYLGAWLCSNVSINDNQWHHVGYTLNQSNLTFFVDGAYAGNFSSGTIAAYGNPETWIGSNNAGGIRLFNGTIDELVVYNRSLNYTEVLDTYRVRIDKYFWKVNVTDGSLQNETVFQRFHIKSGSVNTPPNVTTVAITPTFANTTDRMICTFTVSDPNAGDTLKINVTWYNGTAIYQTNGSFSVTNGTSMQANMTMGAQNKGQAWKCGVTASDQFSIGNQTNGTAVTILNSPPFKPILGLPADNNITTNRTLNMTWSNFSDADEDPITWQINITCLGGCSIDNRIFNSSTNETMPQKDGGSTVDDLNYFSDDGYHYNWSVRGYDNEVFGNWSNEANFSIEALVQITLTNNTILFGSKNIGNKDNTTDDNPNPITIKNQGNSFNNVNISSSDMLWDTKPTASAYYQFKADNISQQQGAFNYSGSITTFTNVPTGNQTTISRYNQSNENNTAEVDILIEVPLDEPPGNKTSLLTFTGYYLRVD
ncbi:MAG TPA: LamG-like jellyroll fold domain-containing protein, partial [Candidatus Nanoarchaeia archaeon]|nr:LamG-like jellyroll fold domain-containing protein [Candidatus Nanoarchaeia archaeon]